MKLFQRVKERKNMWGKASRLYHYHKMRWQKWYQNLAIMRNFSKIKLQRLLRYAGQEIPFYAHSDLTQFEGIPIVDKCIFQDNFTKLNRMGFSYEETLLLSKNKDPLFNVRQSRGTSGIEGLFISSSTESIKSLSVLLNKILLPRHNPCKIALFYLSQAPYFPQEHLTKKVAWCYLNLRHDFEKLCNELNTFSPNVLIAPVQTLYRLAQLQQENKINLVLKKVIATAEVLTSLEEQKIRHIFKQPVHQLYQCAEGWLGTTCEFGTLHLNEDSFLIEKEWIDEENLRFVPVITALDRFVQPLIRYRMEDILVMKAQRCPCGDPSIAVENISGRCEDVLYFPRKFNHRSLAPIYSDNIHYMLNPAKGGIVKYQIIQLSPHHLVIKINAPDFMLATAWLDQQLLQLWEKYQVKVPNVSFIPLETPPLDKMFRQTLRQIHTFPQKGSI